MEPVNVAVIYYSATGTVHTLAQAAVEGAEEAGARVRLLKAAEAFIDTTGGLWYRGELADKVYSVFTASNTVHGGRDRRWPSR